MNMCNGRVQKENTNINSESIPTGMKMESNFIGLNAFNSILSGKTTIRHVATPIIKIWNPINVLWSIMFIDVNAIIIPKWSNTAVSHVS